MLELEAKSGIAAMEKGLKKMGHGYLEDPTSERGIWATYILECVE